MIVAAGGFEGRVHLVEAAGGSAVRPGWRAHDGLVQGLAFVEIDRQPCLVTGGSTDGYLRVWNLHDDNPRARTNWPFANIFAIEVVPHDGNPVIACEGRNHDIMLWDLVRNASIQPQLEGHDRTIYVLRSAKLNGKTVLASAGADGTIRLWDIGTGTAH
jgi:WD40 repeat protein